MSNVVQIDPDILIKAMTAAIQAAIITPSGPFAQTNVEPSGTVERKKIGRPSKAKQNDNMCPHCSEAYMYCACENNPLNTKKPKKKELKVAEPEIVIIEEEVVVNKDVEKPREPSPGHIFKAKAVNRTNVVGVACRAEVVTKKRGPMKFMDIQNIGDRIPASKYPEPTDRRPPAEKMKFKCSVCNRDFEDYPANIPQAFIKERIAGIAEGSPLIRCENCHGR